MALLRYPLPEPRGILSHHVALRFLFSEMSRLMFLHGWIRGTFGTPRVFCAFSLPFVSSRLVFLFSLASLNPLTYGYDAPLHALFSHRVHIHPQALVLGVHSDWS